MRPPLDPVRLANFLHQELKRNEDGLVMGSVESRYTLIDESYDFIEIAENLIQLIERDLRERREQPEP